MSVGKFKETINVLESLASVFLCSLSMGVCGSGSGSQLLGLEKNVVGCKNERNALTKDVFVCGCEAETPNF